jgi:uncharacterized protein YceK
MKALRFLLVMPLFLLVGCSSLSYTFFKDEQVHVLGCQGETEPCQCAKTANGSDCIKHESKTYRGTKEDLYFVALPFAFITAKPEESGPLLWTLPLVIGVWPFAVVDLPLSFVSDTILYPYTSSLDKMPIASPDAGKN